MHTLFIILTSVGMLAIFISFIYSTFKNKQHTLLCNDFYEIFAYYPDDITAYEKGGVLFTLQKDIHFLLALSFEKNIFFVRKINKDLYEFIREQLKNQTSWIKINFLILLFGAFILITSCAIFSLFIKNVH